MPYVERNPGTNAIIGLYNLPQPGIAEEYLPDDDPEVQAFLHPPAPPPTPTPIETVVYDHENRIRSMEGQPPLTLGDFLTKMRIG